MLVVTRRSYSASMAIVQRWARAHTGCHSCWRLGDLLEAHGRRHSGMAAAAILVRVSASSQEAVRRMAMHLRAIHAARRLVGTAEGKMKVAAVAVAGAAAVAQVAGGIAQAREPV
jgi:hypothetical protein